MSIFYNEGALANTDLTKWSRSDTYTFTTISGLGTVTCHGPAPGQYTLIVSGLPSHQRIRYRVFWHFVDSLDNEQSQFYIDGVLWAQFTKTGFPGAGVPGAPVYSVNRFESSVWVPTSYSYEPWGSGSTANGYVIFDTGYFDHVYPTLTIDHILGHDQAQPDEAMYLSHVEVEVFETVSTIITTGLYLHLDAAVGNSFPGTQRVVFRANLVNQNQWVDYTHYQQPESLPVINFGDFLRPPPQAIAPVTTTTTSTTTTTTTEPPSPITVLITASQGSTVLAHHTPIITFTLSESVTQFELANVMYAGQGSLSGFNYNGQTSATVTLTPTLDTIGSYTLFVPSNSIKNSVNTFNLVSNTLSLVINTILPEMTITIDDNFLITGERALATFTSSNATSTFSQADITVTGPITITDFTAVSSTVYTANILPVAGSQGQGNIQVTSARYTNLVGNRNKTSNVVSANVNTILPSMVITTDDNLLTDNQSATLTFTSNLATNNFTLSDVYRQGHGSVTGFTGSGTTYSATYTPDADAIDIAASNYDQPSGEWTSYIRLGGVNQVSVGRGHMAAVFDTSQGNLRLVSTLVADTYGDPVNESANLITFLNSVSAGQLLVMTSFDATSVTTALRTVLNTDFGGVRTDTWTPIRYSHIFAGYKAVATRTAYEDIIYTGSEGILYAALRGTSGSFSVNVAASSYTSLIGNPNTVSNTLVLTYDTERPVMVIYTDDKSFTWGETTTVYFVASQATNNFIDSDITIIGPGTLSGFTAVSDRIYTATLTPTTGTVGTIQIYVASGGFTNSVGNPNLATRILQVPVNTVTTTTTTTTTTAAPIIPAVVISGPATYGSGNNTIGMTFDYTVTLSGSAETLIEDASYGVDVTSITQNSPSSYTINATRGGIPYAIIDSGSSVMNGTTGLTRYLTAATTTGSPGDDSVVNITLPFNISFPTSATTSVSGSGIVVGTNSFIALGSYSGNGLPPGPTLPPIPAIFIGARDSGAYGIWGGSTDGNTTYIVRFEGTRQYSENVYNRAWEVVFYASDPTKFTIRIDPTYWENSTEGDSFIKNDTTKIYPKTGNLPVAKGQYFTVASGSYTIQVPAGVATSSTGNPNTASNTLVIPPA